MSNAIIDWYNLIQKHPEWLTDEIHPNTEGTKNMQTHSSYDNGNLAGFCLKPDDANEVSRELAFTRHLVFIDACLGCGLVDAF